MAAPYQYPQYQQGQQYQQQHHQYQQGQQYQQLQQYHQPRANGYSGYQQQHQQQQHPAQQSPTEQYTQQNYQQQYSQQQYPQQQYSQSQYPNQQYATAGHQSQQYGTLHQNGYQQSQGPYAQPAAQAPSQSCFNCGAPGHFAQDCPEPKRQVPAGALNPEQHRRQGIAPTKRSGQIVTKFGPHGPSSQGSPGGYAQYPPSHTQSYTPSYTPTTPQSAPSSAQSWPQQGQQYVQHQQYQQPQSNGYYQAPPTPQQTWPNPGTPASVAPFGTPHASQASPSQSQQDYQVAQTPQDQYGQGWGTLARSAQQPSTLSQQPGKQYTNAIDNASASPFQKGEDDQFAAMKSTSSSPSPQKEDTEDGEPEDGEPEEDDLDALDVPDLPPSTAQYGGAVVPLIGMPIPANFVVADALFPMDPPAPENEGRCQSKYSRNFQTDALSKNIRDSIYWKDHKEDVVFLSVSTDVDLISFDECRAKVWDYRKSQEEVLRESRSESRSAAPPRKDAAEAAASLEQLEKALAQAKADIANREKRQKMKKALQSPAQAQLPMQDEEKSIKTEPMSPPQSTTIENGTGYQNDPEDVLASLGVTGTAKPVGPPTRLVSQHPSANGEAKSRSGSASKVDIHSADQCTHVPQSEYQQPNQYPNDYAQNLQNSQQPGLPPAPPQAFYQHPYGQPPHADGASGSPIATSMNPFGYGPNGLENGYGDYQYQAETQPQYPPQLRSESLGNRKRGYDERSSSEESEEAARRQEDDITPKLKRRQPKVAEAYSRRW